MKMQKLLKGSVDVEKTDALNEHNLVVWGEVTHQPLPD